VVHKISTSNRGGKYIHDKIVEGIQGMFVAIYFEIFYLPASPLNAEIYS
jgi:hypothetical protein